MNLEEKIEGLKAVIYFRDFDEDGQNTERGSDTNQYFWVHDGERDRYIGRLEALKEIRDEL